MLSCSQLEGSAKLQPRNRDCWLHSPPSSGLRVLPDSPQRPPLAPPDSVTPPCAPRLSLLARPALRPALPLPAPRSAPSLRVAPSGASPRGRPRRASLPPPPLRLHAIQPGEAGEPPERDRQHSHPAAAGRRRSP